MKYGFPNTCTLNTSWRTPKAKVFYKKKKQISLINKAKVAGKSSAVLIEMGPSSTNWSLIPTTKRSDGQSNDPASNEASVLIARRQLPINQSPEFSSDRWQSITFWGLLGIVAAPQKLGRATSVFNATTAFGDHIGLVSNSHKYRW